MKTKRIRALVATLLLPIALMASTVAAAQVAPLNCPTALVNGGCTTPTNRPSYEARVEHLTWNAGQWANALNACQGRSTGHIGGVSCANVQAMSTLCRSGNAGSSARAWCHSVGLIDQQGEARLAIVDSLNAATSLLDATDRALAAALRKRGSKKALEQFDSLSAGGAVPGCGTFWDGFKTEAKAITGQQSRASTALQTAPMVLEALAGIKAAGAATKLGYCQYNTAEAAIWPERPSEERDKFLETCAAKWDQVTVAAVDSMLDYVRNKYVCR